MINLAAWTEDELRAGLSALDDLRKTTTPELVKLISWTEALHPRDAHGHFVTSGTELGRQIIDDILHGIHDGMTQRSRATHQRVHRELRRAGLHTYAEHYWEVVRQQQLHRTGQFVHPRTAFGHADARQRATTPEVHVETPVPTPVVDAPAAFHVEGRARYYMGDMARVWSNGHSGHIDTRQLIEGVIRPGGGPHTFVRSYRNARNAGMSHADIMNAAADESNRLDPHRSVPYTPEQVFEALREQYRLSGRNFSPTASQYEINGRGYEWGTRPASSTDPAAPTIGRLTGGPLHQNAIPAPEPSRPAGEPAPSGSFPVTPPMANDDRYIPGTGPGRSVTSADRILYNHPTGGINAEVQKLYERDLLKFQQAGGNLIFLKNGDTRFAALMQRFNENVYPNLPHDNRHQHGAGFLKSNLQVGASPYHNSGGSVIALDKDGNPIAAVGFSDNGDEYHVGVAGSAGLLPGAGMAMQWGMANICVEHHKKLGSSYLPDAKPAHASWGRRITVNGSSRWTLEDVKKIAEFRPAAPAIQKGA